MISGYYGSVCGCGNCGRFKYGFWPQTEYKEETDQLGKRKADPNKGNNAKGKGKVDTINNANGAGTDKTYKARGKGFNLATYTCVDDKGDKMADDWEDEFHAFMHDQFQNMVAGNGTWRYKGGGKPGGKHDDGKHGGKHDGGKPGGKHDDGKHGGKHDGGKHNAYGIWVTDYDYKRF